MNLKKIMTYATVSSLLLSSVVIPTLPNTFAEEPTRSAATVKQEVEQLKDFKDTKLYKIKAGDKIEWVAESFDIDATILKQVSQRSKYKLTKVGNWAVLFETRYLILSDESFHEYAVYDLKTPDETKKLPYSKIQANDKIKQLLSELHEKLGHLDASGRFTFSQADIVSEDALGYVVRHGDHFHYVYKKDVTQQGDQFSTQGFNESHHANVSHEHSFEISADTIVSEDENGYVVRHGDHYHYVFKNKAPRKPNVTIQPNGQISAPNTTPSPTPNHTEDAYQFNPKDIVGEDKDGYIVLHGDHHHYIYKKDLTKEQLEQIEQSRQSAPNTTPQQPETPTPPMTEHKTYTIQDKVNFIARVYGIPTEAIRVSDGFFVFSTPGHAYDPTHIHPYAVRAERVVIPERSDNPEVDFENELLAIARLEGVAPEKINVVNGQFEVPHEGHNHYLNMQSTGAELYYKNRIPAIVGEYIEGSYDANTVLQKIQSLKDAASQLYLNDTVKIRRIHSALQALQNSLTTLSNNSTEGYLKMLDRFDREYVHVQTDSPTDPKIDAITQKYQHLTDTLRDMTLTPYHLDKQQLLKDIQTASVNKDLTTLTNIENFLQDLQNAMSRQAIEAYKYIDFFVRHLDNTKLDQATRDEVATLLVVAYDHLLEKPSVLRQNIVPMINMKNKIIALQKGEQTYTIEETEAYKPLNKVHDNKKTLRQNIEHFIDELKSYSNDEFFNDNNTNASTYYPDVPIVKPEKPKETPQDNPDKPSDDVAKRAQQNASKLIQFATELIEQEVAQGTPFTTEHYDAFQQQLYSAINEIGGTDISDDALRQRAIAIIEGLKTTLPSTSGTETSTDKTTPDNSVSSTPNNSDESVTSEHATNNANMPQDNDAHTTEVSQTEHQATPDTEATPEAIGSPDAGVATPTENATQDMSE